MELGNEKNITITTDKQFITQTTNKYRNADQNRSAAQIQIKSYLCRL